MELRLSISLGYIGIKSRDTFDKIYFICLEGWFFILVQFVYPSPFGIDFREIEDVVSDDILVERDHSFEISIFFLFFEQNASEISSAHSNSLV